MSANNMPAFPVHPDFADDTVEGYKEAKGMTLRDYFAAAALAGSDWSNWEPHPGFNKGLVNACYAKADEMLRQRKERS